MKTLGDKISKLRVDLGMSQAELARKIDLTPAAVSLLEKNERKPSLDVLGKIAEVLGVSTSYFLEEDDKSIDPKAQILFRGYGDLSNDYQEMLFDYFKLLKEKDRKGKGGKEG